MRIVVAIGGNALLHRGERPDAAIQRDRVAEASRALAPLVRAHEVVLCHGNGPQVGVLALESQDDTALSRPFPLDVLVAETQGMIGYWLAQELRNAQADGKTIVSVVTQTVIDRNDAAFAAPTKPIGPLYRERDGWQLGLAHDWTMAAEGTGWRRVVASPSPLRIVEIDAVEALLSAGAAVVCGGGGGVPVAETTDGALVGVEAVIDKDLTAARIAVDLHADRFVVLTDVEGVLSGIGTPDERVLPTVDAAQASAFPAGSMQPKIAACGQFANSTGKPARIGALADAAAVVDGRAGTLVTCVNT